MISYWVLVGIFSLVVNTQNDYVLTTVDSMNKVYDSKELCQIDLKSQSKKLQTLIDMENAVATFNMQCVEIKIKPIPVPPVKDK